MSRGGKKKKAKIAEILRKLTESENEYATKLEDYSQPNVKEEDFEIDSKEIGKLLYERASTEEESIEEKDWVVIYDPAPPETAGSPWNLFPWTS